MPVVSPANGSRAWSRLDRVRFLCSACSHSFFFFNRFPRVLAKSIFNPNFALFEPSSSGAATYQFNRLSAVNPDHLAFFRFVGVVLAKAVQDGRLLDAHFVRSVYRQLLGAKNMGLSVCGRYFRLIRAASLLTKPSLLSLAGPRDR